MRQFILICLCLLTAALPARAVMRAAQGVQSVAISADQVECTLEQGGLARIQALDAAVVRVRITPGTVFSDYANPAVAVHGLTPPDAVIDEMTDRIALITPSMKVLIDKSPFRITFFRADNSLIVADDAPAVLWDDQTGLILAHKVAPSDEAWFGLGERGGPLNRRGRSFLMKNVDNFAYGELTDPLYQSYPFYYGLRGGKAYGIFLNNPAGPFFNMNADGSGLVTFGASRGELDYYVFCGPQPLDVARSYARLTGLPPLPPRWTLGYHHSRYGWQSAAEILNIATQFRSRRIPCDALYFDIDYLDQKRQFTWNSAAFPDPVAMNASLEAQGFRRVNIIEPAVLQSDPLWNYMATTGCFLKDAQANTLVNSIWMGPVSWIDMTNPSVRDWYRPQLKTFLAMGISAIWNDLNEPAQNNMPEAIYDCDGHLREDLDARNLYALYETGMSYQAQRELRPMVRPWVLSRSGYSGIQRYAATWSGDTLSTTDSLRVSVQMSLQMGLSGVSQFGHDIGGFLGSPSPELYQRWLEFAALTPFMRTHCINTAAPREPWSFKEPYATLIRQTIENRYRWLPYLYTLQEENSRTGAPVLAPTFFYFPGDAATIRQDDAFLLGRDLLVAPVVTTGTLVRQVYLPAGCQWTHLASGKLYEGGQKVQVNAPLGQPPLFAREGAILPQGPVMQYTGEAIPPDISVEAFPGAAGSFDLYEDDGVSFDYAWGKYLRTHLSQSRRWDAFTFSVSRLEGTWKPPSRSWTVTFRQTFRPPQRVTLNGVALAPLAGGSSGAATQGWSYQAAAQKLSVTVKDSTATLAIRVDFRDPRSAAANWIDYP